jgi:hypothetical protein
MLHNHFEKHAATMIGEIAPENYNSLDDLYDANSEPVWINMTVKNKTTYNMRKNDPSIALRLALVNTYIGMSKHVDAKQRCLEFTRLSTESKDQGTLNPRIELVPRNLLPKNAIVHVRYEMRPISRSMDSAVFQFMDHAPAPNEKRALPLFSIEMRKGQVRARWQLVNADGSYSKFETRDMVPYEAGQWYVFDIYAEFKTTTTGFYRVYINGVQRCNIHTRTASSNPQGVQLQFGLYGQPGIWMQSQVHHLLWERVAAAEHASFIPWVRTPQMAVEGKVE